jgi:hypothetical protein
MEIDSKKIALIKLKKDAGKKKFSKILMSTISPLKEFGYSNNDISEILKEQYGLEISAEKLIQYSFRQRNKTAKNKVNKSFIKPEITERDRKLIEIGEAFVKLSSIPYMLFFINHRMHIFNERLLQKFSILNVNLTDIQLKELLSGLPVLLQGLIKKDAPEKKFSAFVSINPETNKLKLDIINPDKQI